MRLTEIAQHWIKGKLHAGDTVIDATLGNGFDALFLAKYIGKQGTLYGFDIQQQALTQSKKLLSEEPCHQHLYLESHANMADILPVAIQGKVQVIMFNLGWLPGSDKNIITVANSTISALEQSLTYLADNGRITVMVYPGHDGGNDESIQVMQWLQNTCQQSHKTLFFEKVEVPQRPSAPILLKISKK